MFFIARIPCIFCMAWAVIALPTQNLPHVPGDFAPGQRNIQDRSCVTGEGIFIPTQCLLVDSKTQGFFEFDCANNTLFVSSAPLHICHQF